MPDPIVCFLTDFGLADSYAGVLKGALLARVPAARLVDLTHEIPPQDVQAGAFQLLTGYRFFPEGTLFVAIVDPGVGTARGLLYAEAAGQRFLAPDNGLLSWVFMEKKPDLVLLLSSPEASPQPVSRTFHGRDVVIPLASRILTGTDPRSLGKPAVAWVEWPFPEVRKQGSQWTGEVLLEDRFGNLITNIRTEEIEPLAQRSTIWMEWEGGHPPIRGLSDSYSGADPGRLLAIGGSAGFVELAVRDGSAARLTGLRRGANIVVHFRT